MTGEYSVPWYPPCRGRYVSEGEGLCRGRFDEHAICQGNSQITHHNPERGIMSKRMGSNRFGKCRQTMCFLARILNRGPGDRLPRKASREQPFLRMRRPPVAAQDV